MNTIITFIRREPVLAIAGVLAACSAFWVPPGWEYIGYCNLPVLGILFCLMVIVGGLSEAGLFRVLTHWAIRRFRSEKWMIFALCMFCFFGSALVTNDVALITFVPFTLGLLRRQGGDASIFAVTMETVSANLGSLITPIGNPQNLYLYTYYKVEPAEFLRLCLPLGGICLGLIVVILLARRSVPLAEIHNDAPVAVQKRNLGIYGMLFGLCLCAVLKVLPYWLTFFIVLLVVLCKDRKLLLQVDYMLLLTFVCFFVFVGNVARIPWISRLITNVLAGRELGVSIFLSQIISNVPAATMLSAFTDKVGALLIGTNIGGLGTLIASMASLISYRQICAAENIRAGRYLAVFSAVNIGILIVLAVPYLLFSNWYGL